MIHRHVLRFSIWVIRGSSAAALTTALILTALASGVFALFVLWGLR